MRFKIRQGHDKEWEELVKMYMDGYGKATPGPALGDIPVHVRSRQRRRVCRFQCDEVVG